MGLQIPATDAEIAVNRFGYGARPGEIARAGMAPRQWLLDQLQPIAFDMTSSRQVLRLIAEYQRQRNAARDATPMSTATPATRPVLPAQADINALATALACESLRRAIDSTAPFAARLLDFFSNHFSVSAVGLAMRGLAPTLEREAIAPHLAGKFEEMLLAVEHHPAMLEYLNNRQSIGPDSPQGHQHDKGLNENLAREILELHTLGVAGGYQQGDVRELALALTGWSVGNASHGQAPGFLFRKATHQPGERRVLGKLYPANGVRQTESILRDLARHPATARHLGFKLARHFIADQPPAELVDALGATWLQSNGDLKAVLTTLVQHPASWQAAQRKLKSPREFVISSYRATQVPVRDKTLLRVLESLGQLPFTAGSPAGFGDTAESWDGAEALLARIDWADAIGSRVRVEPLQLAATALGGQLSPHTAGLLAQAESRQQAVAMLLMSPEFQRR